MSLEKRFTIPPTSDKHPPCKFKPNEPVLLDAVHHEYLTLLAKTSWLMCLVYMISEYLINTTLEMAGLEKRFISLQPRQNFPPERQISLMYFFTFPQNHKISQEGAFLLPGFFQQWEMGGGFTMFHFTQVESGTRVELNVK